MSAKPKQTKLVKTTEAPCAHCRGPTPGGADANNSLCPECIDEVRAQDAGAEL